MSAFFTQLALKDVISYIGLQHKKFRRLHQERAFSLNQTL